MISPGDKTRDKHGPIICRAVWRNWLMCSRPSCVPFMMTRYAWSMLDENVSISDIDLFASSPKEWATHIKRHLAATGKKGNGA